MTRRRQFLKMGLMALGSASLGSSVRADERRTTDDGVGCLVDTTLCIGCRKCEEACNKRNQLSPPARPFTDKQIFRRQRRPSADAFTVVNQYAGQPSPDQQYVANTHVKIQCMHCLDPACVSACVVGAMRRASDGSVVYKPEICLGCRYCMVACPFEIPAYEYDVALAPRVRKCEFCTDQEKQTGADPACAAACPTEALVFGTRKSLLVLARERLKRRPDRYVQHIYGEKEAGGTAWLYLTGRPAQAVGLLAMPEESPARRTESIQHGVYQYGVIPLLAYGGLGTIMWLKNRGRKGTPPDQSEPSASGEETSR